MSPPQLDHRSGNSSPTRAMSFAHAICEVSCERGFSPESQRVIRREDAVVLVPVFSWRRHEVRQTIQKLKRREFNDAVGIGPGGFSRPSRADPVAGLVSGQHVANSSDAAVFTAVHGESLESMETPLFSQARMSPAAAASSRPRSLHHLTTRRRAEAVDEGDGAESRARSRRCVGVTYRARRRDQQSLSRADCTAGKSKPTSTPMMAITTSNSTSVKPCRGRGGLTL